MNKELKDKWIAALRSGEYKQGDQWLFKEGTERYCCLGVLCSVSGIESDKFADYSTLSGLGRLDLLGGDNVLHEKLWKMNDVERRNFTEIADWIEQNVPVEA